MSMYSSDFITLEYIDIFHSADWDDDAFRRCFSRSKAAFETIKIYAGYEDGYLPYTVDEFHSYPSLSVAKRVDNSAAIDSGFINYSNRYITKVTADKSGQVGSTRPWWQFWR